MAKGFNADEYVDVAERIREFYAKYPDGRLTTTNYMMHHIGEQAFVAVEAAAYREPDDPVPGVGLAWEPVPGATNFTKNSELMNAETSAWGRAIVALGFETKHIASMNEVRNRQTEIDAEKLFKDIKARGHKPSVGVATITGVDASTLDKPSKAITAILDWAKRDNIQGDPVEALLERLPKQEQANGVT